ncbi:P-loop NTPase fold protein [Psychrobacter sp. 5A.1]|uniref:KAP family P-loop NTPase fold protein n=1 Tax=Psychrobacter sp. 5A.1 TaxID=3035207 RepID=UPI0025B32E00|nr:P-loop NTPase fold protein [Psychrobacter sp. 5A.1]MDN3503769.1 P-loop NTPase fold protein [Psychrobacter sp. 5A.1]
MSTFSNLTDTPKVDKDQLGIDKYKKGLKRFLMSAQTPLTVAIQGEWGSGKTTLMNFLRQELCTDKEGYYGVWINTWEYGLMMDASSTLTNIITAIINQVIEVIEQENSDDAAKLKKKAKSFITKVSKAALKTSANMTIGGGASDIVDSMFETEQSEVGVRQLRDELQSTINDFIAQNPQKGFMFFIDDLDRINPPVAVQILELLKNLFDLNNCVFLLAIDYEVVVKGLEPKFGKKTMENEREFRSFFEKIIQLPFSMPVNNYEVQSFLIDNLKQLKLISESVSTAQILLIEEIGLLTVGKNPRAIKRLMNAISLVKCINDVGIQQNEVSEIINFFLLSVQISYPQIYNVLAHYPNFMGWDNELEVEYQLFDKDEDIYLSHEDEEWKQILFKLCKKDFFLQARYAAIVRLFERIEEFCKEQKVSLQDTIREGLELSSVTSVGDAVETNKVKKDFSTFNFQGKSYNKGRLVNEVVKAYVRDNPNINFSELEEAFPTEIQGSLGVVTSEENAVQIYKRTGHKRYYIKSNEIINVSDGKVATSNQWKTDNIEKFVNHVNKMGLSSFSIQNS